MLKKSLIFVFIFLSFLGFANAQTQQQAADTIMILPFENISGKPEFNWVGESFADSLTNLLVMRDVKSSGLEVISNDERKLIQQRLNIPLTAIPSVATSLKLARESRSTLLLYGTYNITPAQGDVAASLTVRARIVRVNDGKLLVENFPDGSQKMREIVLQDALANLQTVEARVLVQALLQLDRGLTIVENKVIELSNRVPARAFEAYIKGLLTPESALQTREAYFKNAMRLYAEDKSKENVEESEKIYTDAALELGHLYLNQRQNQNAVDYFSKIPAKDSHYAEAAFYTGLIYWQQKDYEQALAVLRPLADDLKLTRIYNTLGAIAVQAARAESKNKGKSDALLNEGIEFLKTAAESDQNETDSLFNYGLALFLNNKFAEAANEFRPVLAARPTDGEAYYLLSKSLERTGDANAAEFDNQARKYLPTYARIETEWQRSKQLNDLPLRVEQPSRKDFVSVVLISRQNAIPQQPVVNETETLLDQAKTFYKAGRDDDAMQILRRITNGGDPMNAPAYLMIGNIYMRRAETEAAVNAYKTALFWDNRLIDAHISLGKIFLEKKDCRQAQTYVVSALQLDENNQEALALQRQVERCSN